MSVILSNASDTVVIVDCTLSNASKVVENCKGCVSSNTINLDEVIVVAIVCVTAIVLSLIALWAFYLYKIKLDTGKDVEKINTETAEADYSIKKQEKDDDFVRYKERRNFDMETDKSLESQKTEQQRMVEFIERICNTAKDKDGRISKEVLNMLFDFYSAKSAEENT